MKKFIPLLITALLLAACGTKASPESGVVEEPDLQTQLVEKDGVISDLELQVAGLEEQLELLQSDYDSLLASEVAADTSTYLCDPMIENMRYQNPTSAIAILEGWFAGQPQVQELQGSYSTQFWTNINSRIHTIRYIEAGTGLSTTTTFLIFFEEGGWQPGLLNMTDQCWVDFPG